MIEMAKLHYEVEVIEVGGLYSSKSHSVDKKNVAVGLAKKWSAENPEMNVFIHFFRPNDGQHGFLNPDGSFELVGKTWTREGV